VDETVCLGCGKIVGPVVDACACEPVATFGPASSGPYRSPPANVSCPRCGGRLVDASMQVALVLDCGGCGGVFVPSGVIEALTKPENERLRLAFPKRERADESAEVRYLKCPVCERLMNRVDFVKGSGIIVDVCKDDGIWFDAGEVNAMIELVESGGLAAAKQRAVAERNAENDRLRRAWRRERQDGIAATWSGRRAMIPSSSEEQLIGTFAGWLRWRVP
jgi:Zn-finger nucleic acid-binding protein